MWAFFETFFRQHDFLLTPSMAVSPFPVEQNYPVALTTLLGFSPGGTIAAAWARVDILLWPGLLSQAIVAAAVTWGAWHVTKLGRAHCDRSSSRVQPAR